MSSRLSGRFIPIAQRHRNALSVFASAALHVVFALVLLGSARGGSANGYTGVGESDLNVVVVSLQGLRGATAEAAATPLDRISERLQAETRQPPVPEADASATSSEPDREPTAPENSPAGQNGRSDQQGGGQGAKTAVGLPGERAEVMGTSGAEGDALLAQITRCRSRVPGVSKVTVTLELVIDDRGVLIAPPRIIRPMAGAPRGDRLIAEGRIIRALEGCGPYRSVTRAGAKRVLRLDVRPG